MTGSWARTVVLLDDDAERRAQLAARLRARGLEVRMVRDAAQAIAAISQRPLPDLAIIDWWSPERWEIQLAHEAAASLVPLLALRDPQDLATVDAAVAGALDGAPPTLSLPKSPFARLGEALAGLALQKPGLADDPRLQAALEQARTGALRATAVARYLATYGGVDTEARQSVDLRRAFARAIEIVLPELRLAARLELVLDEPPRVFGSEKELGHALYHLLLNAAQAMVPPDPERQRIEARTGTDEDGWGFAEVSDSGPGVSDEARPHLFDPFFSTKGGRVRGLGLYLTRKTVVELGGRVVVDSEPGRGSRFRLALPPIGRSAAR